MGYEPPESFQLANELLYSFFGGRSLRVHFSFKLSRIGFYPSLGHHEAQKLARTNSERTFQRVEFHDVHMQ